MERLLKLAGIAILLAGLLLIAALLFIRSYLQDEQVQQTQALVPSTLPQSAMFIFPHPDDEITVAGTMSKLASQGVETTLICLTKGEQGATGGLVEAARLAEARATELKEAAAILQVDHLEILDFPDGKIAEVDSDLIKGVIQRLILKYRPSVVVTYDNRIGFYGHPDHRLTGQYVYEVVEENSNGTDFPVKRVYFVTLSAGMIAAAMKISPTFQQRYPEEPQRGLPAPDLAVDITAQGAAKRAAMLAHQTQWRIFAELQPLYDVLPGWIYYRVFDREYYALALNNEP